MDSSTGDHEHLHEAPSAAHAAKTASRPCLYDSGMIQEIKYIFFTFKALNFTGRLKRLSLLGTRGADGAAAALFAIATPVEPPSITEIRTKTFIFQTKHRMDFAPVGIDTRWVV